MGLITALAPPLPRRLVRYPVDGENLVALLKVAMPKTSLTTAPRSGLPPDATFVAFLPDPKLPQRIWLYVESATFDEIQPYDVPPEGILFFNRNRS